MIKNCKIFLFSFILVLFCGIKIYSQEFTITNYSIVNSLRGIICYTAFQDQMGFLWFATKDGAYKFDGKNFTRFALPLDIKNNNVTCIFQDSEGNLWFSLFKKLIKYNGRAFITLSPNVKDFKYCRKIIEDNEKSLWFSDYHSLFCLKNSVFTDLTEKLNIKDNYLRDIIKLKNGELVFVTTAGIKKFDGKNFHDLGNVKFKDFKDLTAFFIDSKGVMWAGFHSGKIIRNGNGTENVAGPGFSQKRVNSFFEDKYGNIWVSTYSGLWKYEKGKFDYIKTNKDTLAKLINYLFEDKEGNLWACTSTGTCRIQRNYFSKVNSFLNLKFDHVSEIAEDQKGRIWFGSYENGLLTFDENGFRKFNLSDNPLLRKIKSIFAQKNGSLWFGTQEGLVRLKDGKIKLFTSKDGLKSEKAFYSFTEDKYGNLWFCNSFFVCKFDGTNFTFPFSIDSSNIFSSERISSVKKGYDNELWFGSPKGFKYLDGREILKNLKIGELKKKYGSCNLIFDKNRDLWIAIPGKGFSLVNSDGSLKEIISQDDGLLDHIFSQVFVDKHNNFWLGTSSGISKFDINEYKRSGKKNFENYRNSEYDVTSKVFTMFEDSNSNIWFGTSHGILKYHEEQIDRNEKPNPPLTYITGLKLFLDKFDYSAFSSGTDRKTGLPTNLELPYDKNYLSFSFIGLNYTSPENVEYRYKLNGFDSTWSPIIKGNEVTYTNLPHGKYKFEVQARNKDGIWSLTPASISFVITPPFWKTWWFYLICVVLGSSAVYGYIRVKTRNLEKQKMELEKTVDLRTKELQEEKSKVEEINRELEKSRYQLAKINELQAKWLDDLSESEKQLMEINTNKDKLFSIISHDLKSPFRSLLTYSESMLNKLDSMTVKEIKEYTEEVHRYSENIYRLLEDLLEWSRIQIGRMEYDPKEFNLSFAVVQTIEMLKGNAEKKNIILQNKLPGAAYVYADENMIKSVLNNLISNAIKFTHLSGQIEITAARENGSVQVSVCDNGIGMAEEEMVKLFKIEKHFHKPGTANEKGTGLGLILCKELIEKNGGEISVQSVIGKGTNFIFTIPAAKD